jgi:hypothetical protein
MNIKNKRIIENIIDKIEKCKKTYNFVNTNEAHIDKYKKDIE